MMRDPAAGPPAPRPYDDLDVVGVTPSSTHEEVLAAAFPLMASDLMTPERQAAWDELRDIGSRLAADLFLLDVDMPADAARELDLLLSGLDAPGPADVTALLLDELRLRLRAVRSRPSGPASEGGA